MQNYYTSVHVYGNYILYRGIENGKPVRKRVGYAPTLFVHSKNTTEYKTIKGEYVAPMKFQSIREAKDFLQSYDGVSGVSVLGNTKFDYTFIGDNHPNDIEWHISDLNISVIDIEVDSSNGFPDPLEASSEINAITFNLRNKTYCLGFKDFTPPEGVTYFKCTNEEDLLILFLSLWVNDYPDVITGWNVKGFDIRYLYNRLVKILGENVAKKLSPWGIVTEKKTFVKGREQSYYFIYGIATLDYIELYRKYAPGGMSQESYRLGDIATVELDETKIDYSKYGSLQNLYEQNFQVYMEYNLLDKELIRKLEDKLKLLELALTLAYDSKTNYEDVFKQVRMWDAIIFNHFRKKKLVLPPITGHRKDVAYEGAYVKDPIPGKYKWLASFDLNSLYPHLIMQYNISPEMFVEPENYPQEIQDLLREDISVHDILNKEVPFTDILKKQGLTITPNKQFFHVDRGQGFLSEIMEMMYEDRSKYKNLMIQAKKELQVTKEPTKQMSLANKIARYNNLQLAKKVSLNSAYGAIGNQYFRFFDTRQAEAITLSGQLSAQWIERKLNEYLNKLLKTNGKDYVVASDTDSVYLSLAGLVEQVFDGKNKTDDTSRIIAFMDRICEDHLQKYIDDCYLELAQYTNAYAQKMKMKREALVDVGIWTAKKRYILNVWNNEGVAYSTPEMKITGLEAIKSSVPKACRSKIKEVMALCISGTEKDVMDYIDAFRVEYTKLPVESIASPRGLNGLMKYWDQGRNTWKLKTPIHVKGAILYNRLLQEKKVGNKYEKIKEGEKIKYIYLKEPNIHGSNVISFSNELPKEFQLEDLIDYNTQFEKTFIDPVRIVLDAIGWKTEKVDSLEDFFT